MASIYPRNNSPFWWLKWRNPKTGKTERFSTGFKRGIAREHHNAIALRNEYYAKETARASTGNHFSAWVDQFLRTKHASAPRTLDRYLLMWKTVNTFLDSINIHTPEKLRREHCFQFIEWRKMLPHLNGKKPVCLNTILLETRVLSNIMNEAVKRGWIEHSPVWRLGIKRERVREKDEISEDQVKIILDELARRSSKASTPEEKEMAHYLTTSFEIARHQGIRLRETWINLDEDLDWENWKLRIHSKTGTYETFLNPALAPLFKRLKADGRKYTFVLPKLYTLKWWKFFNRLRKKYPGFGRISFHSTRVTVVSRLERAGMPENLAMHVVNHSSTTIHRVYRKVKRHELDPYWSALSGAVTDPAAADKPATAKNPGAPPSTDKYR